MGRALLMLVYAIAAMAAVAAFSAGPAAAAPDCSARLLADWQDGRIDRTYPVHCYREALASLPEDLQVYSTAESDLTRALQASLATPAQAQSADRSGGGGGGVSPLLILAVTAGLVVAGGSLAAIAR